MGLQIIEEAKGRTTGIFIPMSEWQGLLKSAK